ncbi:hypothetical protein HQ571_03190 [Candidatus Kuenenbacteria bacterium]|nr:hypothetical protein [Candidatus Kuenenbacteria bacterium]
MIGRFILGAIMCVIGFLVVKKPRTVNDLVGSISFADKYFPGGTYSFLKFVGIMLIAIGFLIITNLHGKVIEWMVGFLL